MDNGKYVFITEYGMKRSHRECLTIEHVEEPGVISSDGVGICNRESTQELIRAREYMFVDGPRYIGMSKKIKESIEITFSEHYNRALNQFQIENRNLRESLDILAKRENSQAHKNLDLTRTICLYKGAGLWQRIKYVFTRKI